VGARRRAIAAAAQRLSQRRSVNPAPVAQLPARISHLPIGSLA
jgi:hypothetical protein